MNFYYKNSQITNIPVNDSFFCCYEFAHVYITKKGTHDFIQNLQNYFSLDIKILSFKLSMIIYNLYQYMIVSFAVMNLYMYNIFKKRFT